MCSSFCWYAGAKAMSCRKSGRQPSDLMCDEQLSRLPYHLFDASTAELSVLLAGDSYVCHSPLTPSTAVALAAAVASEREGSGGQDACATAASSSWCLMAGWTKMSFGWDWEREREGEVDCEPQETVRSVKSVPPAVARTIFCSRTLETASESV